MGTLIKEKTAEPFVQKSKRHHSPNSEKQIFLGNRHTQCQLLEYQGQLCRKNSDKAKAREFRSSSYPTISYRSKGTAPLLDNWKSSMCVNLHASWQSRLTKKRPNLSSHPRKYHQHDCLLKNRKGTALRTSRVEFSWIKWSTLSTRNISFPGTTDHFVENL